ncbi:DUF502 domain-containing protein [Bdellovibrionota bacterium FG-1]
MTKNLWDLLKRHFFAGLLVVIPLGVISWIGLSVLAALWRLHEWLPDAWQPERFFQDPTFASLFNLVLTVGATLVLASGISALGWASKQYLGMKLLHLVADLIQRIPVIRGVYSALDQLLRTFAASGSQQFSRVVYLEYPRKGLLAIAFVTSPARGPSIPPKHLNVYVPTTPNPTSGFHLIVPESEVVETQMSVENAFKTLLSLGIAQPAQVPEKSP